MNYFDGEWRKRRPDKEHLKEFLCLADSLCVFDLGASGGVPPPFCWILDGITLINFEPDNRATTEESGRNFDIAIGPHGAKTFYINRRQTTSSLLPPCQEIVNRYDFSKMFPDEPRIFETVSTVEIETIGLDDAVRGLTLPFPDFLKIDVQGLTLEVLETGIKTITESVMGIQAEVEFIETYEGQTTFGSVHEFLRNQDFEIFRLSNLNRWFYKTSMPLTMYTGQDVFCDLLYLRNLRHLNRHPEFWTQRRIFQFVRICLLYDLTDTAAAFLEKAIAIKLIDKSTVEKLAELIRTWTGAMNYFYHSIRPAPKKESGRKQQFIHACDLMLKSALPTRIYRDFKCFYDKYINDEK